MCYLQAGDLAQAEASLKRAVRAYPHEPTAFMGLGQVMVRQEKPELGQRLLARSQQLTAQADTLETYAQAVRTNPRVPQAHYNLAVILARFGRYAQAEGHYLYALKLDSTYVLPYEGLGLLYQRQGQNERAVQFFLQVVAHDSTQADAYNNLGLAYHRLGQLEKAVGSYQMAVRLKPDQVYYYSNLGTAYRDLNQVDKAHQMAAKALKINPDLAGAQELLGDVQALSGDLPKAIATWRRLAKRTPANKALAIKIQRAEKLLESGNL
jgi:tetratricopeptide (TPR) repeat protein